MSPWTDGRAACASSVVRTLALACEVPLPRVFHSYDAAHIVVSVPAPATSMSTSDSDLDAHRPLSVPRREGAISRDLHLHVSLQYIDAAVDAATARESEPTRVFFRTASSGERAVAAPARFAPRTAEPLDPASEWTTGGKGLATHCGSHTSSTVATASGQKRGPARAVMAGRGSVANG